MKKVLLFTFLLFLPLTTYAYDGSPKEQVEAFFNEFETGKVNESIDNLYLSNPAFSQKKQSLTLIKQQIGSLTALYGKYISNDNVHYEDLTPSLVRIVQIANYEIHPVTWEFYFYKQKNKWVVSQAQFADQFQFIERKK